MAGTSEIIQLARTMGNASAPWNRNIESCRPTGSPNQSAVMSRPLITTTMGVSYGEWKARANSATTAARSVVGISTSPTDGRRSGAVMGPAWQNHPTFSLILIFG